MRNSWEKRRYNAVRNFIFRRGHPVSLRTALRRERKQASRQAGCLAARRRGTEGLRFDGGSGDVGRWRGRVVWLIPAVRTEGGKEIERARMHARGSETAMRRAHGNRAFVSSSDAARQRCERSSRTPGNSPTLASIRRTADQRRKESRFAVPKEMERDSEG